MSSTTEPPRDIFDAGTRGLQHHGLRRANERAVLTVVGFNPGVSNADIARLSGLAPQTVSAILADIDRAGMITRGEVLRGRRGQPATPIYLRADGAFSIGVEIGWRHVSVVRLNMHAEVVGQQRRAYDYPDARTLIDDIGEMTYALVAEMEPEDRVRLVDMGVSMPSNLPGNLQLVQAPEEQRSLWQEIDIAAELAQRTGLEISLFNDGNAACWAELIAFPRPRPATFVYFLISHHIAAGIVSEGSLWEGPTGNSANLGSMLVMDSAGRLQAAHFVASITSLINRLAEAGITATPDTLEDWDWSSFGSVLDQWIEDCAVVLARVVFNTTAVIESGLVVIDSIIPDAITGRLIDRLSFALSQLPVASYQQPEVVAGHLGVLAPAIGAAELPLYRRYFSRALVDIAS
ncbi:MULTISPECIES: ROK family transcriptional regulator [Devosia]|uniref:ROK family transcriptional regulator n=1 Tax=Devosia litorisediminis TaxID=2829817 RepID=A0A942I6N9_9HYPH|nr:MULTISPECIES: ROK family transcriptional regulator [Devosia]MBS3849652.1 ROK family transcriptional regulator [Devosia litorisediminis]MCZ4347934.1 ROK family transcriptional regulator [Devosia neptuniae]